MSSANSNKFHHRARVAALSRSRPPNDPDYVAAQSELAATNIEDYITRTLAAAPPLSDEQRTRLAELLRPVRIPSPDRQAELAASSPPTPDPVPDPVEPQQAVRPSPDTRKTGGNTSPRPPDRRVAVADRLAELDAAGGGR